MNTFKDYVLTDLDKSLMESPQHIPGDAPFEAVSFKKISDISKRGMLSDYTLLQKDFLTIENEKMDLYKFNNHPLYILGKFYLDDRDNKQRFAVVFNVSFHDLVRFSSKQKQLKKLSTIQIDTVHTTKVLRNKRIATTVYLEILKNSQIISDQLQYSGAVNLWKSLIANKDLVVYIYDIIEDKIISKATTKTDMKSIWSSDSSKRRIRLLAQMK